MRQFLRELEGQIQICIDKNDGKTVASQAGDGMGRAGSDHQALRPPPTSSASPASGPRVSLTDLKYMEIDEQKTDAGSARLSGVERGAQPLVERHAVSKAGERVMVRQPPKFVLGRASDR